MSIKTEPLVDSYTLNIDQDEEKETIYLVHSNVFDSYNLPEDYNIDEDMIAMLIVEDQDNIFSYLLCTLFMTSSSADEFFNILFSQTWKTDISLRFADFDHDGLAEILVKSNELQAESFDVWELFSIKGNKFTNLVTFEGPNE